MESIITRILNLMEEKGITSYRICKDNNIPHASFIKIKKGEQELRPSLIIQLAKYLNVSPEFLLLGKKQEIRKEGRTTIVPVLGSVACGISYKEYEKPKQFIELSGIGNLREPFIVIAKGDSMSPYILNGDFLLCSNEPNSIRDKMIAVISYKTEPETSDSNAKMLRILKDGRLMLYSFNLNYDPIFVRKREIECIYKVEKVIREIK